MSMMKERFTEEVTKAFEKMFYYMDKECEIYLVDKTIEIFDTINKALEKFAILKAVFDEVEKYHDSNIWDKCIDEDKYFEETFEMIEKIEDLFD